RTLAICLGEIANSDRSFANGAGLRSVGGAAVADRRGAWAAGRGAGTGGGSGRAGRLGERREWKDGKRSSDGHGSNADAPQAARDGQAHFHYFLHPVSTSGAPDPRTDLEDGEWTPERRIIRFCILSPER